MATPLLSTNLSCSSSLDSASDRFSCCSFSTSGLFCIGGKSSTILAISCGVPDSNFFVYGLYDTSSSAATSSTPSVQEPSEEAEYAFPVTSRLGPTKVVLFKATLVLVVGSVFSSNKYILKGTHSVIGHSSIKPSFTFT